MAVQIVRSEPNPFDWAIKSLGLTRAEFSRISGLGRPYLLRVGQGRHAKIGDRATHALYTEALNRGIDLESELDAEYGVDDIHEAWDLWVLQHRRLQTMPNPARGNGNPFARLVKAVGGVARMSALLAVPDPLVERYAKGKTARMPMPIREALQDMKYPHIDVLDAEVQKWMAS